MKTSKSLSLASLENTFCLLRSEGLLFCSFFLFLTTCLFIFLPLLGISHPMFLLIQMFYVNDTINDDVLTRRPFPSAQTDVTFTEKKNTSKTLSGRLNKTTFSSHKGFPVAMASTNESGAGQAAPAVAEVDPEVERSIQGVQSRYLRCPSPR